MQDLSHHSLSQLRTLEAQVVEELKKRHFLGVSQAREQILHIARGAGLSVKELLAGKGPKEPKAQPGKRSFVIQMTKLNSGAVAAVSLVG